MTEDTGEALRQAARNGDLDAVTEALETGVDIESKGPYGDTPLNEAAEGGHLDVVRHLVEAGANIRNLGGADKTPIMNAAFAGHLDVVRFLLKQGAEVTNDLLSSVQMKVNILKENTQAGMVRPEGVRAWESFLNFLIAERLKQDLPDIVERLDGEELADREAAAKQLLEAARHGLDISAGVSGLTALLDESSDDGQYFATKALTLEAIRAETWSRISDLLSHDDPDIGEGAISALCDAARHEVPIEPLVPTLTALLSSENLNLRHDAAVTLGYGATHGQDVSEALAELTTLLSDEDHRIRKIGGWALYRIAKVIGPIDHAIPALKSCLEDESEEVREMAAEALAMAENREESADDE